MRWLKRFACIVSGASLRDHELHMFVAILGPDTHPKAALACLRDWWLDGSISTAQLNFWLERIFRTTGESLP